MVNVHRFDQDSAVVNDFYHMSNANDYLYAKRRPIDIEAGVGREGKGIRPARPMIESSRKKCGHVKPS